MFDMLFITATLWKNQYHGSSKCRNIVWKKAHFRKRKEPMAKTSLLYFYSYVTFSFLPLGICHQPNLDSQNWDRMSNWFVYTQSILISIMFYMSHMDFFYWHFSNPLGCKKMYITLINCILSFLHWLSNKYLLLHNLLKLLFYPLHIFIAAKLTVPVYAKCWMIMTKLKQSYPHPFTKEWNLTQLKHGASCVPSYDLGMLHCLYSEKDMLETCGVYMYNLWAWNNFWFVLHRQEVGTGAKVDCKHFCFSWARDLLYGFSNTSNNVEVIEREWIVFH